MDQPDLFSYINEETDNDKASGKERILTVLELTQKIKSIIEPSLSELWVEGEVSNYKKHTSGHHYFSLKDDKAVISCVMWRSAGYRLEFTPGNGEKVKVYGNISVYEASGRYQIDVKKMQPVGAGELQMLFEKLKQKLFEEGIFDSAGKKSLPYFIKNVGVVTAETGAAFQDIRKVIRARAPHINIYLYNARVQGRGAENEIVEGIKYFNSFPNLTDVIIVGRGGGSLEDLWPFNEECVARALSESVLPTVSAVGHEIDMSISDLAADVRAATPSQAAELVSINSREEIYRLKQYDERLYNQILSYFIYQKEIVRGIENSYAFKRPADIIKNYHLVLDNIEDNLNYYCVSRIGNEKNRLDNFVNMLRTLDPGSVINRGYAVIRDKNSKRIITASKTIKAGQKLEVGMKDGSVDVTADQSTSDP